MQQAEVLARGLNLNLCRTHTHGLRMTHHCAQKHTHAHTPTHAQAHKLHSSCHCHDLDMHIQALVGLHSQCVLTAGLL